MNNREKGFTLIEIMLALFIFAIVAGLTSAVLYNSLRAYEITQPHQQHFSQLQTSQLLFEQDFAQLANRPILNEDDKEEIAFDGKKDSLVFTRSGYINPLMLQKRSQLQRVSYYLKEGSLIRKTWQTLDRLDDELFDEMKILTNVSKLSFRYLDNQERFVDSWDSNALKRFPFAIEVSIELENKGTLLRLFRIISTTPSQL